MNATPPRLLRPMRSTPLGDSDGEIWLIGAGPGDPDLLTIKALRLLERADVVVHDRLVPAAILELARSDAERIDVGKTSGHHALPQDDINALLVSLARQGKLVARLKGGDPFIFGRGGEEMQAAQAAGIHCTIVPGITAASACAASTGIPLTHRDYAQSVRFVTGHTREVSCEPGLGLDWSTLATPGQTLVFYMGLANAHEICQKLIEHGRPPDLPCAFVERGTLPGQRVISGTLSTLPALAAASQLRSPALLIVGEVVALHQALQNEAFPARATLAAVPLGGPCSVTATDSTPAIMPTF